MMLMGLAIALALVVAISVTLILAPVVVAAAVLFVLAVAAIAISREDAAGEADEASYQQEYGKTISEFHELPRTVLITFRLRHWLSLTLEHAAVRTLQHSAVRRAVYGPANEKPRWREAQRRTSLA